MKVLLKSMIVYFVCFAIFYLTISFIELDFDVSNWERERRAVLAIASFIMFIIYNALKIMSQSTYD